MVFCPVASAVPGRCRIGHAVRGGIGGDKSGIRKLRETDGLHTDTSLKGCKIGLRAVHLVDTHTVANEIEHILGAAFGHGSQHAEAG